MTASSEIDMVMKLLCNSIDPSKKPTKITHYFPIIFKKYPKFRCFKIILKCHEMILEPWKDWSDTIKPEWWRIGYNKVKHERNKFYKEANLINALNSVTGLLSSLLYYYKQIHNNKVGIEYVKSPKIFTLKDCGICPGFGYDLAWRYRTPDE